MGSRLRDSDENEINQSLLNLNIESLCRQDSDATFIALCALLHPEGKITIIAPLAMVAPIGSPAMVSCKPRQARKGATVAVRLCAGVWLVGAISISDMPFFPWRLSL